MADVPDVVSTDPVEMLNLGKRHLAVKDYSSAANCLSKACEILAETYGQRGDECGDAYFWYGKSLLGLAREESGVLGDGIPGAEESQEDGDDDEEVDEDNNEENDKTVETAMDETDVEAAKEETATENSTSINQENTATEVEEVPSSSTNLPSSSKDVPSSSADGEAVDNEEDDDEIENLQLAWEVFELARDIFLKRGDNGKKELADCYLYLGEVSLESETYDKAILDMGKSLELFKELYSNDDRRIAETHYQIGLAHSLSNGFDDAVEHFKSAAEILETRIKNLQNPPTLNKNSDENKPDPFYSADNEIKELTELLPEIKEKVQDMIDYKAEAIRTVKETLGLNKKNGESTSKENGSAPVSTERKQVSDISHLIKRKRKPEDDQNEECNVIKKVAN